MQQLLPWILAALTVAMLVSAAAIQIVERRRLEAQALPGEWALATRAVFGGTEKKQFRWLREALPLQVILRKPPLVRFCPPTDPLKARHLRCSIDLLPSIAELQLRMPQGRVTPASPLRR